MAISENEQKEHEQLDAVKHLPVILKLQAAQLRLLAIQDVLIDPDYVVPRYWMDSQAQNAIREIDSAIKLIVDSEISNIME